MNWNQEAFSNFPFPISAKSSAWQDDPLLDAASAKEFSKLFLKVFEKRDSPQREIRAAIQRWPNLPHFQFLMAEAMYLDGQNGENIIFELRQNHPNYLFSRVMDLYAFADDQIEDVDFALSEGNIPTLPELYPERKIFHAFEAHQYEVAASYYNTRHEDGDAKEADAQFYLGVSLFHNRREFTMAVASDIVGRCRTNNGDDWDDDDEDDMEDEDQRQALVNRMPLSLEPYEGENALALHHQDQHLLKELLANQHRFAPHFELEDTYELYSFDNIFPTDFLYEYLSYPRDLVIRDLQLVLQTAATDYQARDKANDFIWAPWHALILLTELRAFEAIPEIIAFLSLPRPVTNFYLGDYHGMYLDLRLALLLMDDPARLDALVLNTKASSDTRILPAYAMVEVVHHIPTLAPTIEDHLLQLLHTLNQNVAGDSKDLAIAILNSDLMGVAVRGRFARLFAATEEYYQKGLILDAMHHIYPEYKDAMQNSIPTNDRLSPFIDDLSALYAKFDEEQEFNEELLKVFEEFFGLQDPEA